MPFQLVTANPAAPAELSTAHQGQSTAVAARRSAAPVDPTASAISVRIAEPTWSASQPIKIRPAKPVPCITAKATPAAVRLTPTSATRKVT